ncbi:MAG: hypothetical protein JRI44_13780 [Deltaproteobacteria bacterium]|nr:hypothetical protein [Deltaproteobacteria bacterium]
MSNFEIGVKIDESGAVKSLSNVDKSIEKIGDTSKKTAFKSVVSAAAPYIKSVALIGATVAATTFAVKKFADGMAEAGDNVGKASQRMGVSIEFYQKMGSAAEHAGTSIGTMESGMRKMLLKMTMVEQGNKLAIKAFDDLGIAVFDSAGNMRDQEEVFTESLIALSKMSNATARNAKAQEVLGRSASTLAPLFNEGADAVKNYMEANDSAVMVSKRLTTASALYNDTMQTVGEQITKVKNDSLTPFMEAMANMAVDFQNSGMFDTFIDTINSVGTAFSDVFTYVSEVSRGFTIGELEKDKERLDSYKANLDAKKEAGLKWIALVKKQEREKGKAYQGTLDTLSDKTKEYKKMLEIYKQMKSEYDADYARLITKTFEPSKKPEAITKTTEAVKELNEEMKLYNQYYSAIGPKPQKDLLLGQILDTSELNKPKEESQTVAQMIFGDTPSEMVSSIYGYADQVISGVQSMADNVFSIKENARQREFASLKRQNKIELKTFKGSNKAKEALMQKHEAEEDSLRKKSFEKKKEYDKKTAVINMFSSIGGAWASAMQLPYPANVIVGGATSAMLTGVGIANVAQINAQEYFANSGIVGSGGGGATGGGDNRMVGAREGELFLNGRDQKTLFDWIKGGIGGGGTNVNIENFSGNDEDLSRLEDMLYTLQSNDRFTFA